MKREASPRTLPTVLQQRYHIHQQPEYEVIVVNDNSEDDSKYYLASIENGYSHYRHIEIKQAAQFYSRQKYPLSIGISRAPNTIRLCSRMRTASPAAPNGCP